MARKRKPKIGRPAGTQSQILDLPDCPYIYGKPILMHGKWRVRRRTRADGSVSLITLPIAEDLGQAIADVNDLARKAIEEARAAALPPGEAPPPEVTVKSAWKEFLEYVKGFRAVRSATLEAYRWDGGLYLEAFGAENPIRSVTTKMIEEFIAGCGGGRSRIKHLGMIKRWLRWCKTHSYIRENPAEGIEIPPAWRDEVKRALYETGLALNVDEARALVRAAREKFQVKYDRKRFGRKESIEADVEPREDLLAAVLLGLLAGLRRANLSGPAAVRWADLVLKEGEEVLSIDGDRMKGKRDFTVPLNAELAAFLRDRRRKVAKERRTPDIGALPVVGALTLREFQAAARRAKLLEVHPRVRPHDLRHSFGGFLENAPQGIFQHLMDHSKARVISDRYRHPDFEEMRKHLSAIPPILAGEKGTEKKCAKG